MLKKITQQFQFTQKTAWFFSKSNTVCAMQNELKEANWNGSVHSQSQVLYSTDWDKEKMKKEKRGREGEKGWVYDKHRRERQK